MMAITLIAYMKNILFVPTDIKTFRLPTIKQDFKGYKFRGVSDFYLHIYISKCKYIS